MTAAIESAETQTSAHWADVASALQQRAVEADALLRAVEHQRRPYVLAAKTGSDEAQALLDRLAEKQREIERDRDDLRAAVREAEREQRQAEQREAAALRLRRLKEAREIIVARQLLAGAMDQHLSDLARTYAAYFATSQALVEYEDLTGRGWSNLHRTSYVGNALAKADPALARFISVQLSDSNGLKAADYEAELWAAFLSRTAEA